MSPAARRMVVAQRHRGSFKRAQPFALDHARVIMEPDLLNPVEVEGVLNPAAIRSPEGSLYLFPRLVARGNYSRIGLARVRFDADGEPTSIERMGIALEPSEPYEKNPFTGGGCEDPRITYLEPFGRYVMTYTAFSSFGPRIALAVSEDLVHWQRLGLARFSFAAHLDLDSADNKDALLFPSLITNPRTGQPAVALIHRPFLMESPTALARALQPEPPGPIDRAWRIRPSRARHPSMWISYCDNPRSVDDLTEYRSHRRLLSPRASWERLKVGGGAPPLPTPHGWLVIYHGVAGQEVPKGRARYSAGAVILDPELPEHIRFRSSRPILRPTTPDAHFGALNVVFPTALDQRLDLGQPERVDVYFGIGDRKIGVATLHLPNVLDVSNGGQPAKAHALNTASASGWGA